MELKPGSKLGPYEAGTDFVRIFPSGSVGGAAHIKAVNLQTAVQYPEAGASALGIGGELMPAGMLTHGETAAIADLAAQYAALIRASLPLHR
jgi:2-keto-3-deoxy-6-phosphogluconate aldolase